MARLTNKEARNKAMKNSKENISDERDSTDELYENRYRALERVLDLCQKSITSREDSEELEKALDHLAVAHTMLTFDFASGSFSS
jgi:hypothetical protein